METETPAPSVPASPAPTAPLQAPERLVGLLLACGAEYELAMSFEQGWPKTRNTKPCSYYWKEALRPGKFQDSKGNKWEFKSTDIDAIVEDINRAMKLAGHEPSLDERHPTTDNPNRGRNFGWIRGAQKNSLGRLELLHQFVGKEEENEALNKKTSVLLLKNRTDQLGNPYRWWLEQNAVLSNPQLRDLDSEFKPALAASNGQPVDAVALSLAESDPTSPQGVTMDLSTLRTALGQAAKDQSDDQVIALALSAVTALAETRTKLRTTLGPAAEGKPDTDLLALCADQVEANGALARELTAAEQQLAEAKSALALSAEQQTEPDKQPDPQVMALSAKLADKDVELAETRKQITPKQAIYLRDRIKSGSALVLSADVSGKTPIDDMIAFAALAEGHIPPNKPTGSVPVQKALALANDSTVTEGPMTPERKRELLALAGYPVAAA